MISWLLLFIVIVIVLFILKCKSTEFVRKLQKKKEVFIENARFSSYIIRYQIFFVILQPSRRRGCFLKEAGRLSMRQKTDINGK